MYRVITIAGSGEQGQSNGKGDETRFSGLQGIVIDERRNRFLVDGDNYCIRKVSPDGVVSTVAGAPSNNEGNGGKVL